MFPPWQTGMAGHKWCSKGFKPRGGAPFRHLIPTCNPSRPPPPCGKPGRSATTGAEGKGFHPRRWDGTLHLDDEARNLGTRTWHIQDSQRQIPEKVKKVFLGHLFGLLARATRPVQPHGAEVVVEETLVNPDGGPVLVLRDETQVMSSKGVISDVRHRLHESFDRPCSRSGVSCEPRRETQVASPSNKFIPKHL